jgi:hypothetical protein
MFQISRFHPLAGATAGVALAFSACAAFAERVSFDGTQYFGINPAVHAFKGGAAIVHWQGRATMTTKNPNSIFQNLILECAGVIDVRKEGEWKAEGYCDHIDRDGDAWVGHWWGNHTMQAGKWEFIHGTGKYAGASGSGTSKYSELKSGANGLAFAEVTGFVDLKR